MLQVQLENSESTMEGDCPLFVPTAGVEGLHQCAEQIKKDTENSGNIFTVLKILKVQNKSCTSSSFYGLIIGNLQQLHLICTDQKILGYC